MRKVISLLALAVLVTVAGCGSKSADNSNDNFEYTTIDFLCDDTKPLETKEDIAKADKTESTDSAASAETTTSTSSASPSVSVGKETQKATQSSSKEDIKTQEQWDAYVAAMNGYVYINDLKGKSLQYARNNGYSYIGCVTMSSDSGIEECRIHMTSTKATSEVTDMITKLSKMTVSQLKDEYFGVYIDYKGNSGNYKYTCNIGSIEFEFELDNGEKAIKGHEDDSFFALEDAEQVQNDKLKNVKFVDMTVYGVLDTTSSQKLAKMIESKTTNDEKSMGELTFEKVYYETK